jgi:hypothetical protein
MKVLAIGSIVKPASDVDKKEIMPKEVPATLKHYLDGKIEQFWASQDAPGGIFLKNVGRSGKEGAGYVGGATGATRSVATKFLLEKGFPVRAFVHKDDERASSATEQRFCFRPCRADPLPDEFRRRIRTTCKSADAHDEDPRHRHYARRC